MPNSATQSHIPSTRTSHPRNVASSRSATVRHNLPSKFREACLTCPLFITIAEFLPQHHKQLEDTRALIARAKADGHTRMAEMNRTVETNLLTIITTIEADQHDCQCTAECSETQASMLVSAPSQSEHA